MHRVCLTLVGMLLLSLPVSAQTPTSKKVATEDFIGTKAGETKVISLPGGVKLKQIWCPPGTFTMGTPGETNDESTVEVTLSSGFWAAATETTQGQWISVMGATSTPWSGKELVKEGPNFPATWISHGFNADGTIEADSATAFCEKLTEIELKASRLPIGWKYTLPTEAQWEYMCRAGTKTKYSFGDPDTSLGEYAWFANNAFYIGEDYAHAVGTKKANPWGFFDLHGNVWEWSRDGYERNPPGGRDPFVSPLGAAYRIFRGGSWFDGSTFCESAYRNLNSPSYCYYFMGFRLATAPVE